MSNPRTVQALMCALYYLAFHLLRAIALPA